MKKRRVDQSVEGWTEAKKMYLRTGGRFERAQLLWTKTEGDAVIEAGMSLSGKRMVTVHLMTDGTYRRHDDGEGFTLYIEDKMSNNG